MHDLYAFTQQMEIVRNVMNSYLRKYLYILLSYFSKLWRPAELRS